MPNSRVIAFAFNVALVFALTPRASAAAFLAIPLMMTTALISSGWSSASPRAICVPIHQCPTTMGLLIFLSAMSCSTPFWAALVHVCSP